MKLNVKAAKANFFDRQAVLRAVDRARARVLSKFGAFVRRKARSSIKDPGKRRRQKGDTTSRPGRPPFSHVGTLRKLIFFSYDRDSKSVVIGPVLSNSPTGAPENLEYGGEADIPQRNGRTVRAKIRPRPFMGPAFREELPKLEPMWRDSVR